MDFLKAHFATGAHGELGTGDALHGLNHFGDALGNARADIYSQGIFQWVQGSCGADIPVFAAEGDYFVALGLQGPVQGASDEAGGTGKQEPTHG